MASVVSTRISASGASVPSRREIACCRSRDSVSLLPLDPTTSTDSAPEIAGVELSSVATAVCRSIGCHVAASAGRQASAVEIDRRAADLFHVGFGNASADVLLPPRHECARQPFTRFLRHGGRGVRHSDHAPHVIGLLGDADIAPPAIDAEQLRNGQPVAEGNAGIDEAAEPRADALADRQRLRQREPPDSVVLFGMQPARNGIERALTQPQDGVRAVELAGIDARCDGPHIGPRLAFRRTGEAFRRAAQLGCRRTFSLASGGWLHQRGLAEQRPLQQHRDCNRHQRADGPPQHPPLFPKVHAAERDQRECREQKRRKDQNDTRGVSGGRGGVSSICPGHP